MLHLRGNLLSDDRLVDAVVGDHHDLARPGRQIDRHVATHDEFGGVHRAVPGPKILSTGAIDSVP